MDATERNMMMSVLKGRKGDELISAIDRAPKDENLLRNVRRELYDRYAEYEKTMQQTQNMVNNRNWLIKE